MVAAKKGEMDKKDKHVYLEVLVQQNRSCSHYYFEAY
jgi:hypothetical protein